MLVQLDKQLDKNGGEIFSPFMLRIIKNNVKLKKFLCMLYEAKKRGDEEVVAKLAKWSTFSVLFR